MAHYAFLDENNVVVEVIYGNDETTGDWETYYGKVRGMKCVRTSYNGNIRRRYAGVGYTYDESRDAFIAPQPFPSWSLDDNHDWVAPTPQPEGVPSEWNEETQTWDQIPTEEPAP